MHLIDIFLFSFYNKITSIICLHRVPSTAHGSSGLHLSESPDTCCFATIQLVLFLCKYKKYQPTMHHIALMFWIYHIVYVYVWRFFFSFVGSLSIPGMLLANLYIWALFCSYAWCEEAGLNRTMQERVTSTSCMSMSYLRPWCVLAMSACCL